MILFLETKHLFLSIVLRHGRYLKPRWTLQSCTCDVIVGAEIKTESSSHSLPFAPEFHLRWFDMRFFDLAAFVASSGALAGYVAYVDVVVKQRATAGIWLESVLVGHFTGLRKVFSSVHRPTHTAPQIHCDFMPTNTFWSYSTVLISSSISSR